MKSNVLFVFLWWALVFAIGTFFPKFFLPLAKLNVRLAEKMYDFKSTQSDDLLCRRTQTGHATLLILCLVFIVLLIAGII